MENSMGSASAKGDLLRDAQLLVLFVAEG